MTTAAPSAIWSMSEALGCIPQTLRRNTRVGRVVEGWWRRPRRLGCDHVRRNRRLGWFVVMPSTEAICGGCAKFLAADGAPGTCASCGLAMASSDGVLTLVEDNGVSFIARFCDRAGCDPEATITTQQGDRA